jgi:hypothetical protein
MLVEQIVYNKALRSKERTLKLASLLLSEDISYDELIAVARKTKGVDKANCIEAMEKATKQHPVADSKLLNFLTDTVLEDVPRIKWESARTIGNIARFFPGKLAKTINHLLINTEDPGMVVRWSSAYALSAIMNAHPSYAKKLKETAEAITAVEKDNAIRKMYLSALKKLNKTSKPAK